MPKPYQMLDLGYPRTPTSATLRVAKPDGTVWDVPLQVVADHRDKAGAPRQEDCIGRIRAGAVRAASLGSYAQYEMDWTCDIAPYATLVEPHKSARLHLVVAH